MTIRTFAVYELRCDCCQRPDTNLMILTSRPALIEAARGRGWTLRATEHRCPTCSQAHHNPKDHRPGTPSSRQEPAKPSPST